MRKQPEVIPRGDVIRSLRAEQGFENQADFAHKADVNEKLISKAERSLPSSVKTIKAILKCLQKKQPDLNYEDLLFLPGTDPPLPNNAIAPDELAFTAKVTSTRNRCIVTIAAPEAVIALLKLAQWNDIIAHLISSAAKAIITKIRKGSVVITIEADHLGLYDLVDSFLGWRLQYLGICELRATLPRERNRDIVNAIRSRFRFPTSVMASRCDASISSKRKTILATLHGLQTIQLNPIQLFGARSRDLEAVWKAALTARKAVITALEGMKTFADGFPDESDIDPWLCWRTANKSWNKAADHAEGALVDICRTAADLAKRASKTIVQATSPRIKPETADKAVRTARQAANDAASASDAAWEAVVAAWDSEANPWENNDCDVWSFKSTFLPEHISTAMRFWEPPESDATPQVTPGGIPKEASWPENAVVEPQDAILLDEETYLNQPQHQPS